MKTFLKQNPIIGIGVGVFALFLITVFVFKSIEVVPAGHVKVATLFGKVRSEPITEGFHFVNPLLKFTAFDGRQKTHKEVAGVPSQDQLTTTVEFSIQYRLTKTQAPQVLKETGNLANLISVHMVPKIRSLVREQGKSVPKAEDFFKEEIQQQLQTNLLSSLKEFASPKGLEIQAVLIRDVRLPKFIVAAIQSKKEREQAAEKQKAELDRFTTEQTQKVRTAEAELKAAIKEAEKKKVLADAKAYEIRKVKQQLASGGQGYIKLQALKSLEAISKDPNAKVYFLNGDSPQPLPLMHMGK